MVASQHRSRCRNRTSDPNGLTGVRDFVRLSPISHLKSPCTSGRRRRPAADAYHLPHERLGSDDAAGRFELGEELVAKFPAFPR